MKRSTILGMALLLGFSLASCSKGEIVENDIKVENPDAPNGQPDSSGDNSDSANNSDSSNENPDNGIGDNETSTKNGKTLVAYFSRTGYNYPNQWLNVGHTAQVATFIEELTGADGFEIIPEVPYPDDYEETKVIATKEYNSNARPTIKSRIDNMEDYDTIFVGNPIWMGAAPMIIRTFYESYDLNGKVIIPFTTHAGSGLGDTERLARNYYPDNTILKGLAVQGTQADNSRNTVETWLKQIGVIK